MSDIFKDLKVIELASVLAGPSVGQFFAELGAEVIKIENPNTNGDVTRSWKLKNEDPQDPASAYFWSVNAFKKFLSLDLGQPKNLQTLYHLCGEADIILTNYKKGDDIKLKVDYDTIKAINPKIIYASVNGFGEQSARVAYDLILQAESGFMSMNGEHKDQTLKMPVAIIDLMAAHQLKESILIALLQRVKSGKGAHISVSLFDSAVASLVNQASNWLNAQHLPAPIGSMHPNIAPYGEIFETKDKQRITFAIGSNKQFLQICQIIDLPLLANQAKFKTNRLRVTNRSELYGLMYNAIKKINYDYLMDACLKQEVPIGKIRNMKEVFELPEALAMIKPMMDGKQQIKAISSIAFKFLNDENNH